MSFPHRLRDVSCFKTDRLRLQPSGEALTTRVLTDVRWWPLLIGEEHDYNGRKVRVFMERLRNGNWYALVWDLQFGVVRLIMVRDDIKDQQLFLRELNPGIEHSTDATIQMVCRET